MEGWVTINQLKNITDFFDKFCGTINQSNRFVYLFYQKGLKIYGTDGCAKAIVNFTREFLPFKGLITIPIQYLKGILRGYKKTDNTLVKLSIEEKYFFFEFDDMKLNIEINYNDKKIVIFDQEFKIIGQFKTKELINSLDFVSSPSNEGDEIIFNSNNNCFQLIYDNGYFKTFSNLNKLDNRFSYKTNYETVRHIVKSLKLLKNEQITHLGFKNNSIYFYVPGIIISMCGSSINNFSFIENEFEYLEKITIDLHSIRKALDKMYVTLTTDNYFYFILTPNKSSFYKEENGSKLSWDIPIKTKNQYLIKLHVRKIRSILTRFNDKVELYFSKNFFKINNLNKTVIFKIKEHKIL